MKTDFRELFEKYMGGNISPDELVELKQRIRDIRNNDVLDGLLAEAFTDKAIPVTEDYTLEEVFQQLMDKAREADRPETITARLPRFRWLRYAAAAVLLLSAGAVLDYGLHRHKQKEPIAVRPPHTDIGPGKDQAILTLAGGKEVVLDSTAKGTISNQGGTSVNNINGRISYKAGSGVKEILYNTVTTARGNQYQLVLPDGTKVWLNASSSVRFPTAFTGAERRVQMTGEGYFAVAKDARHPFIVDFNHTEVKVLGTEFNIMAYSDETADQTTLVEGRIGVGNGSEERILEPGKAALVRDGHIIVQQPDIDDVTAWKYGLISFNHVNLHTVMRQISRWYNVDVRYQGEVPDRKFGGVIDRKVNLSVILDFLQSMGVHYRLDGNAITLTP